jgi:uncharacterized membrane protein (UPF0127 family)
MKTHSFLARALVPFIVLSCALSAGAATDDANYLDQLFERSTLQIATPDARVHNLQVWIADDDARRARGLMFVEHLDEDAGMLFVYPQPQTISMWMKNTRIPLDMLFVGADGRVESVVANTEPMSLATIRSQGAVVAVIELNAGSAARMKIGPGAQVMHRVFSH